MSRLNRLRLRFVLIDVLFYFYEEGCSGCRKVRDKYGPRHRKKRRTDHRKQAELEEACVSCKDNLFLTQPLRRHPLSSISLPIRQPDTCRLLTKLPIELRLQIYQHVFGSNEVLHLVQIGSAPAYTHNNAPLPIGHQQCRHDDPSTCVGNCTGCEGDYYVDAHGTLRKDHCSCPRPLKPIRAFTRAETHSLNTALLRTCRQVYTEAVDTLYGANTFECSEPQTWRHEGRGFGLPSRLFWFFSSLPMPRAAAIRSLRLEARCYYMGCCARFFPGTEFINGHAWDCAWASLWVLMARRLTGLRRLELTLDFGSVNNWFRESYGMFLMQQRWITPLLEMRGLREVELRILKDWEPVFYNPSRELDTAQRMEQVRIKTFMEELKDAILAGRGRVGRSNESADEEDRSVFSPHVVERLVEDSSVFDERLARFIEVSR